MFGWRSQKMTPLKEWFARRDLDRQLTKAVNEAEGREMPPVTDPATPGSVDSHWVHRV